MAKRFIDTDIFKKPLMKSLKAPYKLLWLYIINDCNHAGFWNVEIDVAEIRLGVKLDDALEVFKDKIIEIDGGKKWHIPSFIEFQYGELNEKNRVHNSVINELKKYKIKPLTRPLQGAKDKYKDKDKDKDKDKKGKILKISNNPTFEEFKTYALEKKSNVSIEALKLKYESWLVNGWKTGGKSPRPIKNWKSTLLNTLPHLPEAKEKTEDEFFHRKRVR